jgi:hypothetical protein
VMSTVSPPIHVRMFRVYIMLETLYLAIAGVHFLTFCRCTSSSTLLTMAERCPCRPGSDFVLFPCMAEALAFRGFLFEFCLPPRPLAFEILSRADTAKFLSSSTFCTHVPRES